MPNKKIKGFKRGFTKKSAVGPRGRTGKRKLWTNEQMEAAMLSVGNGEMSANKAADLHGVLRSTLKDCLNGRVEHGRNPGPRPYLTRDEKQELSAHLLRASSIGLGKTRCDVKSIVGKYVKSKGLLKGSAISNGWWEKFLKRNPSLSLRTGDSTAGVQLDAMSFENMKAYFDLLREVYNEFDFEDHPEAIYNMDETGVPLEPRPPKVVAKRGQKKVRCRTSGQKAQITVIGCGSATGQILPPFIIFAAKKLNHLWMRDEVSGSRYAISDKGWVDQKLFYLWLKDHFLRNAVSHHPLLLLLDGHSSHFEPQSIEFAKENDIVIFCLPPHTTHECQPLDVGLFGPLKKYWQQECHKFYQNNHAVVITKLNFNRVFQVAWLKAISPSNVCGGFRKSGVFPFNRDAVAVVSGDEKSEEDSVSNGDGNTDGSEIKDTPENGGKTNGDLGNEVPEEGSKSDDGVHRKPDGGVENSTGGDNKDHADLFDIGDFGDKGHFSGDGDSRHSGGSGGTGDQDQVTIGGHLSFSIEEELRFITRYEEGYDLHDERYELWLKLHHPEAIQDSTSEDGTPADSLKPLMSQPKPVTHFSSPSMSSHHSPDQPSMSAATPRSAMTTPRLPKSTISKRSPLSDLMNLPEDVRGSKQNKTPNTGHARVLTSRECLQMLKEKEEKKKQVQLEKESRKVERELKKKQKEEEQKVKAAEKVKRAAEREAAKAKREAAKAEKEAAREEKVKQKSLSGMKRSHPSDPRSSRVSKKIRSDMEAGEDADHCCVCFGSYQEDIDTGREWIQCICKRWLHEDCIDDEDIDSNGKLCPLC